MMDDEIILEGPKDGQYICEWGGNIEFANGTLYDSEDKEVFCKCGQKSVMAIIGKDTSLAMCNQCAGLNDQNQPKLVYKPPKLQRGNCE